LRERFAWEHGVALGRERVLLNYGRLVARKGVAAFLEKGLPLLDPDIKLLIGGRGPEAERLQQVCQAQGLEERVILLGPLSDETVAMLRQSADLFLMPNVPTPGDVEGFGMTHLESMYAGLPVVAFAVDALVESTRCGGYLIPAGQYQAFVDQIHAYYGLDPAQRQAKAEEARTYVRAEYSWEQTARQYLDLFTGRS
jgi:phosphatidylinositol alpha-1,6-mannosyltransferase